MAFFESENYCLILKKNIKMNTEAVRLKLINWISQVEDVDLLNKIDSLRTKRKYGLESLPYEDQQAIEEGLNQLNEGKFIPYSEVRKQIKSLLNPKKPL